MKCLLDLPARNWLINVGGESKPNLVMGGIHYDFLAGLLSEGNESNSILHKALRVMRIGHSSGWDMLAGALTGRLMVRKA